MRTTDSLTDKQLFELIAGGDPQAFADCVHRFTPQLFPYLKSIVQTDFWAEDLLQDLYTKLWSYRSNLLQVERPGAYLNKMAANMAFRFLKRRAAEIKQQYIIQQQLEPAPHDPLIEREDRKFYESLLKESLDLLSPQERKVFTLRHEEGLSYEEIAVILSVSRNTVRNHLVSAMKTIRAHIGEQAGLFALVAWIIRHIR